MSSLKVLLLGTGCPLPNPSRTSPSQVVLCGDEPFLVDCGEGATGQLVRAGLDPATVKHVLITHHHSDHMAGYGHFVVTSWVMGRRYLKVVGPRGTDRITRMLFKEIYRDDVAYRMSMGRPGSGIVDIDVVEAEDGTELHLGDCRVSVAQVPHSVNLPCLAFRFDAAGRSLVISGDTAYTEKLVALAKGSDLLVCEASMVEPEGGRLHQAHTPVFWEKLHTQHLTPREAGRIATQAGVKKLVLSHLLPSADASKIASDAASEFAGDVVVGEDLMEISI